MISRRFTHNHTLCCFLIAITISGCTERPAESRPSVSPAIESVESDTADIKLLKGHDMSLDFEQRYQGIAEQMPLFPGGEEAMINYLKKHIRYPKSAIADGIEGLVYTSFVVDENGLISDIRILKSADVRFNEPTMEVLMNMPAWVPGMHNGEKVSVRYNLPVNYQLQKTIGDNKVTE